MTIVWISSSLVAAEASRPGESDRSEPELRVVLSMLNMNVGRLSTFHADKEEAVTLDSEDRGHGPIILQPALKTQARGVAQVYGRIGGHKLG